MNQVQALEKLTLLGLTDRDRDAIMIRPNLLGTRFSDEVHFFGRIGSYDSQWTQTMASLGFYPDLHVGDHILIDRKRNLVIKRMYVAADPNKRWRFRLPKHCVPTWIARVLGNDWLLCVQPLVDTSTKAREQAWNAISSQREKGDEYMKEMFGRDVFARNVGMYGDQAVVFDF